MTNRELILSSLQKFRSLFSYVADCPDKLLAELAAIIPTKYMVFPCDIIEVRPILSRMRISFSYPIPVFSQKFADKYLKCYSSGGEVHTNSC